MPKKQDIEHFELNSLRPCLVDLAYGEQTRNHFVFSVRATSFLILFYQQHYSPTQFSCYVYGLLT